MRRKRNAVQLARARSASEPRAFADAEPTASARRAALCFQGDVRLRVRGLALRLRIHGAGQGPGPRQRPQPPDSRPRARLGPRRHRARRLERRATAHGAGRRNVAGSLEAERNDLALSQKATDCYEGREHWWAHSILFPDDYVHPPPSTATTWTFATVFDFHNSSPGGGQANFQINAWPATATLPGRPTGLAFQVAYGDQANPTVKSFPIGPVVRNSWYDFVYHVKWSSGPDGTLTAWVNGSRKLDYSGPTLYPGQGCYLKLANYHSPFGKPSSVIHGRVIRGTTAEAVSLTPLEGIAPSPPGAP
jgi:hypothetical protein